MATFIPHILFIFNTLSEVFSVVVKRYNTPSLVFLQPSLSACSHDVPISRKILPGSRDVIAASAEVEVMRNWALGTLLSIGVMVKPGRGRLTISFDLPCAILSLAVRPLLQIQNWDLKT